MDRSGGGLGKWVPVIAMICGETNNLNWKRCSSHSITPFHVCGVATCC